MAVSVQRLIHRGAARDVARDRLAIEDALDTALPQDGRLVLIRKLAVRGEVASPQQRQGAVRRGWVEAVAGAVHATSSFAAQANCVWFASPAEAQAILLRKLLAGEAVAGWFWALAVPGWRSLALGEWLPRRIAASLRERDDAALARIAQACVEAGHVSGLVEAAARALRLADRPLAAWEWPPAADRAASGRSPMLPPRGALVAEAVCKLRPAVLPPAWSDLFTRLRAADVPPAASRALVVAIVREKVRRLSPALALEPALLGEIAEALSDSPQPLRAAPLAKPTAAPGARRPGSGAEIDGRPRAARRASPPAEEDETRGPAPLRPALEPQARLASAAEALAERPHEAASHHAGLWLVVPPLIRLGFREWLGERPELLGKDPGRRLILAIARHHGVPPADPALAMLDTHEEGEDPPAWIHLWRSGLDRWLRRNARRRTHDLVRRPGWIAVGDDRLDVRYPLDAADLRLRRLALDSNAGWTDWLGLSLWFHFGGSGS